MDLITTSLPAATDLRIGSVAPSSSTDVSAPQEFLSRDLSWLEFNRRVLHEALDPRTPLLERLRFLGIFGKNLDEFVMKRVGALRRMISSGVVAASPDGMTPAQTLAAVRAAIQPMLKLQADCFTRTLCPALAENGVHVLGWADLTDAERKEADRYFRANVFPILTPLAV